MFKKTLLSLLASLVLLLSFSVPLAYAQGTWYNTAPGEFYIKVYDTVTPPSEIFGERYTAAQVDWILWSVITWLPTKIIGSDAMLCLAKAVVGGIDLSTCRSAIFGAKIDTPNLAVKPRQSLISMIFADRPISGITYTKDLFRKFHIIPEAEAQAGFGYQTALQPFRQIWRSTRDISYGFFVLIIIVYAFMIMFRVKLSPQTAVSVQSAIPKIVIGLILVTFSYAIAGFLVDLMYVVIGLVSIVGSMLLPTNTAVPPADIFTFLVNGHVSGGSTSLGAFGLVFIEAYLILIGFVLFFISSLNAIANAVTGVVGAIIVSGAALIGAVVFIFTIVASLFIALYLLYIAMKIIFMLVKAYVNIILLTIFAPLQITFGTVFPPLSFGAWVKSYIGNLAIFVVTGLLFLLSYIFVFIGVDYAAQTIGRTGLGDSLISRFFSAGGGLAGVGSYTTSSEWPPLIAGSVVSGNASLAFVFLSLAVVIFTMIPKASELVKSFISGRPFAYGTAIGEFYAPAGTGGLAAVNYLSAKQQMKYAEAINAMKTGGPGPTNPQKTINAIWSAVRGASRGAVK